MDYPRIRPAAQDKSAPSPVNRCACPGCRAHVARLEQIVEQLSREIDRLQGREGRRAA